MKKTHTYIKTQENLSFFYIFFTEAIHILRNASQEGGCT